jgi:ArsR family transcriptional regulator, arsenate/arsenite/antimonite-responsive transcriptional repressor
MCIDMKYVQLYRWMSINVHNGAMTLLQMLPPGVDDACCAPSGRPSLSAAEAHRRAQVFKALADPNRLRLLSIVKAGDSGEACVCDLTEPLELGQPTVSHHLKVLVDAGLLHREKRGTWAYYSLVPGALERAAGLLTSL